MWSLDNGRESRDTDENTFFAPSKSKKFLPKMFSPPKCFDRGVVCLTERFKQKFIQCNEINLSW